jgi:dihydropteroate synthase
MHNRMADGCQDLVNRPAGGYSDLMSEVLDDLRESLTRAEDAGIPGSRILVDPGIGFAKTARENYIILNNLYQLRALGKPILLGASRKASVGAVCTLGIDQRLEGSLAAAVIGVMNGAAMVRVHDVKETKRAVALVDAVKRS